MEKTVFRMKNFELFILDWLENLINSRCATLHFCCFLRFRSLCHRNCQWLLWALCRQSQFFREYMADMYRTSQSKFRIRLLMPPRSDSCFLCESYQYDSRLTETSVDSAKYVCNLFHVSHQVFEFLQNNIVVFSPRVPLFIESYFNSL